MRSAHKRKKWNKVEFSWFITYGLYITVGYPSLGLEAGSTLLNGCEQIIFTDHWAH